MTKAATNQNGTEARRPSPDQSKLSFIDGLEPPDLVIGWATSTRTPWLPLRLKLRVGNRWVASGQAGLYRADLVAAQVGTGWCGFALRTGMSLPELASTTVFLAEEGGQALLKADKLTPLQAQPSELRSVAEVIAADPTVVRSVEQLRGCGEIFTRFIRLHGVDAFVRATYLYILNRPADDAGLRLYAGRIRRGLHQPFEVLQILASSEEFAARQPQMVAPTQPSFPFLVE